MTGHPRPFSRCYLFWVVTARANFRMLKRRESFQTQAGASSHKSVATARRRQKRINRKRWEAARRDRAARKIQRAWYRQFVVPRQIRNRAARVIQKNYRIYRKNLLSFLAQSANAIKKASYQATARIFQHHVRIVLIRTRFVVMLLQRNIRVFLFRYRLKNRHKIMRQRAGVMILSWYRQMRIRRKQRTFRLLQTQTNIEMSLQGRHRKMIEHDEQASFLFLTDHCERVLSQKPTKQHIVDMNEDESAARLEALGRPSSALKGHQHWLTGKFVAKMKVPLVDRRNTLMYPARGSEADVVHLTMPESARKAVIASFVFAAQHCRAVEHHLHRMGCFFLELLRGVERLYEEARDGSQALLYFVRHPTEEQDDLRERWRRDYRNKVVARPPFFFSHSDTAGKADSSASPTCSVMDERRRKLKHLSGEWNRGMEISGMLRSQRALMPTVVAKERRMDELNEDEPRDDSNMRRPAEFTVRFNEHITDAIEPNDIQAEDRDASGFDGDINVVGGEYRERESTLHHATRDAEQEPYLTETESNVFVRETPVENYERRRTAYVAGPMPSEAGFLCRRPHAPVRPPTAPARVLRATSPSAEPSRLPVTRPSSGAAVRDSAAVNGLMAGATVEEPSSSRREIARSPTFDRGSGRVMHGERTSRLPKQPTLAPFISTARAPNVAPDGYHFEGPVIRPTPTECLPAVRIYLPLHEKVIKGRLVVNRRRRLDVEQRGLDSRGRDMWHAAAWNGKLFPVVHLSGMDLRGSDRCMAPTPPRRPGSAIRELQAFVDRSNTSLNSVAYPLKHVRRSTAERAAMNASRQEGDDMFLFRERWERDACW